MRAPKLKSKFALAAGFLLVLTYGCGGAGSGDTSSAAGPSPGSSSGTVTLSWTPPTQNVDGSYLTDLAGYNIYYGTHPDKLYTSIMVYDQNDYWLKTLDSKKTYFFNTVRLHSLLLPQPVFSIFKCKIVEQCDKCRWGLTDKFEILLTPWMNKAEQPGMQSLTR